MEKQLDDNLDPKAWAKANKMAQADSDGRYGASLKARDGEAPGPAAKQPHPSR